MHPVGFEPTMSFRNRIMSAVQSTPLPWMLLKKKIVLNLIEPFDFFILLCAFFYGNLFALQFSTINWGFLLIFIIVFFLEAINKLLYFLFENTKEFSQKKEPVLSKNGNHFWKPKFFNFRKKTDVDSGVAYFAITRKTKEALKYSFFLTNLVKRGFILGFFVEAFKVGS